MKLTVKHSLVLRIGLVLGAEFLFALGAIGASLVMTHALEGNAAAVNVAGSLRMATYRLAAHALNGSDDLDGLIADFEQRLADPRLVAVLPTGADSPLRAAHVWISRRWNEDIKPAFVRDAMRGGPLEIRARLTEAGVFVGELDAFVAGLEKHAESAVWRLQMLQLLALFLTVAVGLFALLRVRRELVGPLGALVTAADELGGGDLTARVGLRGPDELGRLGESFDAMAGELERMYATLEDQVRDKTRSLALSNQSLDLLYRSLRSLSAAHDVTRAFPELLDDVGTVLGLDNGAVCLIGDAPLEATQVAIAMQGDAKGSGCTGEHCTACLADRAPHCVLLASDDGVRRISIPIVEKEERFGILLMDAPDGGVIDVWQTRLLQAIAGHIAMAIGNARGAQHAYHLALLEERSTIARELHDSLAQSLSYLKIQVSRLDALWRDAGAPAGSQPVLSELRDGLNSAYRQLRELLTTFRLKMDGRHFSRAMADTVDEFRQRIGHEVRMEGRLGPCTLGPNQQIHALQILREALSNVARHAQARNTIVELRCMDGVVELTVEDDGMGVHIDAGPDQRVHHGLAIMRERARSLGGDLTLESPGGGSGTRVRLRFRLDAAGRENGSGVVGEQPT